jgi:AbiU2
MALVELLKRQNIGGINSRLSKGGAGSAAIAVRNAMITDLVLLVSRAYADSKPGDLHLQAAADLLKSDKTAREIFDSSNTSRKVSDFEAHWLKCRGDHRRQRIKHFRDKHSAHLGKPKDILMPEYAELFEFAEATVQAMELLVLATRVAIKPLRENGDSLGSAF